MAGTPKTFQKFHQGSQELQRLQKNVEDAFGPIVKNVLLNGRLLEATLASGSNKIEHKLGRKINGYIIVKRNANVSVYNTSDDELYLTLNSSGAASVSIWVF